MLYLKFIKLSSHHSTLHRVLLCVKCRVSGLGAIIDFAIRAVESSNIGEESGGMHLPDQQGEYTPIVAAPEGTPYFSIQWLMDTLMTDEPDVCLLPSVEFMLQLEVMMADHLGCPHPPVFSWNVGMVMHMLKSDPTLRNIEHVQVNGPGMAYLFFFNKAKADSPMRPLRPCRLTLERQSQSGFLTLLIFL